MDIDLDNPPPSFSRRRTLALGVGAVLFSLVLELSGLGEAWLGERLARPLQYRFRHAIGRDPRLDPRLKLYAMGDTSVDYLGTHELTGTLLREVLEALRGQPVKAVVATKTFVLPSTPAEQKSLRRLVAELPFPLVGSAFIAPSPLGQRPVLNLDADDGMQLAARLANGPRGTASLDDLSWMPEQPGFPYGPAEALRSLFRRLGHIQLTGIAAPAFRRPDRSHAIPHLALLLGEPLTVDATGPLLGGKPVPLDGHGNLIADLAHPSVYYDALRSLGGLVESARAGSAPAQPAEAVVVLLQRMASDDTYFTPTPFGSMPGGLVTAAFLNSALTGQWVRPLPLGTAFVLAATLLGLLLGGLLSGPRFWLALAAAEAFLIGAGLLGFAYRAIDSPWLTAASGLFVAALALFAERARRSEAERRRWQEALEGSVDHTTLKALLAHPSRFTAEPVGCVVTVMFVDIVGFSLAAERIAPREAFASLRESLMEITEIVHRHGGVVDKTMGDGLLCFFGYRFDGVDGPRDHADRAVHCAIEIQRHTLTRQLERSADGRPVYPLRIGVNTCAVYVGNLGGRRRLDLTIIGHGVNLAKRLEAACESYCVMIGPSTRDTLVHPEKLGVELLRRDVQVKHFSGLMEAYEADPFRSEPGRRAEALKGYREYARLDRRETRWDVPGSDPIAVVTDAGNGELANFSATGLAVRVDRFLAARVTMTLSLGAPGSPFAERLRARGLSPLVCEVRWGRPTAGAKLLGLEIQGMSEEQRRALVDELRTELAARSRAAA